MSHYKSNVRDLQFNLFEWLKRGDILGQGLYEDIDADVAMEMLHELARQAENEIGESLLDSDRNPPKFDPTTYTATLPEAFKKSYQAYVDGEWWRMSTSPELGGTDVPPTLLWAMNELILGSNPALHMYAAGYPFAKVLHDLGTPDQKKLAQLIVDNGWGATMVLTEPDAGSDVGAGRAKAVQQDDGSWHITGVKRFITSGDADIFDNTVHFVLARPEGGGVGTKGLSLFIVPKFHVDLESGALGERNGAFVTNVEHKMGLKVSTTCEVRFGEVDGIPAVGHLLGDEKNGIAQMFTIIEFARMMVGTKAIATLSTGYLNALDYAKSRVQGPDLLQAGNKAAPRVPIIKHPDVRRSLMLQKCYSEGLRALVLYTASMQDAVHQAAGNSRVTLGGKAHESAELQARLNDLLLPLVKGVGSERAWVLLGTESLQTFGGSGFLQDYPLEQYVRDAKIDTLYEGTTAIQGLDFFFRKIMRDKGDAIGWLASEVEKTIEQGGDDGPLSTERAMLGRGLKAVQQLSAAMVAYLVACDPRGENDLSSMYKVGQNTTRLLLVCGDMLVGWFLVQHALIAQAALDEGCAKEDVAFYEGKVAAASFYTANVIPRMIGEAKAALLTDNSLMELNDDAF